MKPAPNASIEMEVTMTSHDRSLRSPFVDGKGQQTRECFIQFEQQSRFQNMKSENNLCHFKRIVEIKWFNTKRNIHIYVEENINCRIAGFRRPVDWACPGFPLGFPL